MPAIQQLLFPDPRPLVERLGHEFFRSLPAEPGIYIMRDAEGTPLYIGKAKNLRQRLRAYRVANPGRMKRRHLRLLASAVAIDIERSVDEDAALAREAELILLHRPRFNRAGTWAAHQRYVMWTITKEHVEITVVEEFHENSTGVGPIGAGSAKRYRASLVRSLWLLANPGRSVEEMPFGWIHGKLDQSARLEVKEDLISLTTALQTLTLGSPEALCAGVRAIMTPPLPDFIRDLIEKDLERIGRYAR